MFETRKFLVYEIPGLLSVLYSSILYFLFIIYFFDSIDFKDLTTSIPM